VQPFAWQVVLTGWNFEPTVILGLLALSAAYAYGIGPLRERHAWGERPARWRITAFFVGIGIAAFALLSPIDAIGDEYLFSVHMVQHLLLTMAVPPLLLLGTPGWLLRPLLRRPFVMRAARAVTYPLVAFTLFNVDFWIWHAPALYDLTLRNTSIHVFEHLTFLIFATINWMPILSPLPDELPRLPQPHQILYLFLSCQPMVLLGAGLTFAGSPLYTPYLGAPRIFGISAISDQQLGGLIMWIPGNFVYILVMSIIFFLWLSQQEADAQRAERAADAAAEAEAEAEAGHTRLAADAPTAFQASAPSEHIATTETR
jgi:putative membrane protein